MHAIIAKGLGWMTGGKALMLLCRKSHDSSAIFEDHRVPGL